MAKSINPPEKITARIGRVARLWSGVLFVLAILVFIMEIFEAFSADNEITNPPFPMIEYLIPITLFLGVVLLMLVWRWESLGGALALICVIINLSIYIGVGRTQVGAVILILSPVAIPAVLFLVCWWRTKRITVVEPDMA